MTRLLLAHQGAEPDAFAGTLAVAVAGIGGRDVVVLLIGYAPVALTPHPGVLPHGSEPQIASLDGSMAGREAGSLELMATRIDAAARTFPGPTAFATAILGRPGSASGMFTWLTCGHAPPIVVRNGTLVDETPVKPGVPLGMGALAPVVGGIVEMSLQPGDGVLIYTDGVTDSRMPHGSPFGEDRLRDLLAREHGAGASPQEVVRRLLRTAIEHSASTLRDDATMVYLRWDG